MPLTVLTDSDVQQVLQGLDYDAVINIQQSLGEALHSYSTGDTNSPCCANSQPQRIVLKKNGITTLFMPASTGTSVGMKVISLQQPESPSNGQSSISKKSSSSSSASATGVSSAASGIEALQLTPTPPTGTTSSSVSTTTSNTSASGSRSGSVSATSFQPPPSVTSSASTTPRGSVTLLGSTGNPIGIVSAEELTAFRTALAATMLVTRRTNVDTITVFGAGKQAYWHIRLSLLLRGKDIRHINIINRSFDRSINLMKAFHCNRANREGEVLGKGEGQGVADVADWAHVKFSALSPDFVEYGRLLKEEVRKADVIFCCTPSLEPLFPPEFLTSHEGRKKGRYVSAIGSYAPHMIELHPEILKAATKPEHGRHRHRHARQEGVILVDSLEACLKEAGEVIQAKLGPEQLVEIGELLMVKKAAMKEVEMGGEGERGLLNWLMRGNVIYKSVGLGLMDLVVAGELVSIARERGIGTNIEDF